MWVPWDQMYVSKINAIQSGEVPDMSFMGVEQQVEFAEMDAVIPVDDLVEELGGPEAFSGGLKYHWFQPSWSDEGHYWGVHLPASTVLDQRTTQSRASPARVRRSCPACTIYDGSTTDLRSAHDRSTSLTGSILCVYANPPARLRDSGPAQPANQPAYTGSRPYGAALPGASAP